MSDAPARKARPVKLNIIDQPLDAYKGALSLCLAVATTNLVGHHQRRVGQRHRATPHRQDVGHWMFSKTPAYYLGQSHGFNTVHGRMPSVTGAAAVNGDLTYLGVSGDGDGASIGIGQLITPSVVTGHGLHRREQRRLRPPTKGIRHHKSRLQEEEGRPNEQQPIDLCALAINRDAPLWPDLFGLQATHGPAQGSRPQGLRPHRRHFTLYDLQQQRRVHKSYGYVKENEVTLHMPDYIPQRMPMEEVEVPEGHYVDITLHDGSTIQQETIDAGDPSDAAALAALHKADSNIIT